MPSAPRRWRAISAAVSCLAALTLTCSACGGSSSSNPGKPKTSGLAAQVPAPVRGRGVLRVATSANYAPNEFLATSGHIIGMDADLATAIARQPGLRAQFFNGGFDHLITWITRSR